MKAKAKGARNEHRTMQLLEATGYSCTRAAGSLGLFDVVGIGSADMVLSPREREFVAQMLDRFETWGKRTKWITERQYQFARDIAARRLGGHEEV